MSGAPVSAFACGDDSQIVLWLLRTEPIGQDDRIGRAQPATVTVSVPALAAGEYRIVYWDTETGRSLGEDQQHHAGARPLTFHPPPIFTDLAIAIRSL